MKAAWSQLCVCVLISMDHAMLIAGDEGFQDCRVAVLAELSANGAPPALQERVQRHLARFQSRHQALQERLYLQQHLHRAHDLHSAQHLHRANDLHSDQHLHRANDLHSAQPPPRRSYDEALMVLTRPLALWERASPAAFPPGPGGGGGGSHHLHHHHHHPALSLSHGAAAVAAAAAVYPSTSSSSSSASVVGPWGLRNPYAPPWGNYPGLFQARTASSQFPAGPSRDGDFPVGFDYQRTAAAAVAAHFPTSSRDSDFPVGFEARTTASQFSAFPSRDGDFPVGFDYQRTAAAAAAVAAQFPSMTLPPPPPPSGSRDGDEFFLLSSRGTAPPMHLPPAALSASPPSSATTSPSMTSPPWARVDHGEDVDVGNAGETTKESVEEEEEEEEEMEQEEEKEEESVWEDSSKDSMGSAKVVLGGEVQGVQDEPDAGHPKQEVPIVVDDVDVVARDDGDVWRPW